MIELWFVSTQGTISCGAYIFANKISYQKNKLKIIKKSIEVENKSYIMFAL